MLKNFLPSRQKAKAKGQSPVMVADLDAMIVETVSFRLLGRDHEIPPLSVQQFMIFASAYAKVLALQEQEVVTPDQLVEAYFNLVSSVCKTITRDDIRKMGQQQVAALFQIMVDLHTGRLFGDQKKTLEKVMLIMNQHPAPL